MADESQSGAAPAAGQASQGDDDPAGLAPDTSQADSSPMDNAALERELARARREAAQYRSRLKAIEDRDKTEAEKASEELGTLRTENERLKAARREDGARLAAAEIGRKLGFRNPELAYRFVQLELVEYDDNGSPKPSSIERQLAELVKTETYLVNGAAGQPNYGAGAQGLPPTTGQSMNDIIRRAARGR